MDVLTGGVGPDSAAAPEVVVHEPALPRRARRPADLLRLVVVLLVIVAAIAVADVAVGTAGGLEQDLLGAGSELPSLLRRLLGWVAGVAGLAIPLVVIVDLLVRSRLWQLWDALIAVTAGVLVGSGLALLVREGQVGAVLAVLTRSSPDGGRTPALSVLLVAGMALLTTAGVAGRRALASTSVVLVGSVTVTSFLSGEVTGMALFCSLLLGRGVGLAVRYALGAAATRPPGTAVAAALTASGVELTSLSLADPVGPGVRRYAAVTPTGPLEVEVLERDTLGSTATKGLVRRLRLRGPWTRAPALSVKAALEHRMLMALTLERLRISAPGWVAASDVGPFAAVLAYRSPIGRPLSALPDIREEDDGASDDQELLRHGAQAGPLSDLTLGRLWRMLATMQRANVAHRGLKPSTVLLLADGGVGLADAGDGDIAASDIALRLDLTQMLATVGLKVGARRAVASAVAVLGTDALVRALPLLQTVALSRSTRAALKDHKRLLHELRSEVLALVPADAPVEQVEPRRLTPRALLTVVGGAVAAYVLLSQLAQVNLGQVVTTAKWQWALGVVLFTTLTIAGASLVLTGAVPARLRFRRTYMAQLAVAFAGLIAPAAVGNIALNTRYLHKAGVDPAVAGASVGLAQLAQFCSYILLLTVSSIIAGTGLSASFTLPPAAVIGLAVVVAVVLLALALPVGRRLLLGRFVPLVQQVVPRVVSVFQQPRKVVALLGGALLLDLSFVAALTCATRAFGATPAVSTVAVVYFAGAIIGSAVPTPGGLGGVEAALSAGLVAAGTGATIAVSSVLLYRLATYWLPIPFGWLSLNYLQREHAI